MKQTTFESLAWKNTGKVTRRERFFAEMDAVIPWGGLIELIEPHYPKAGQGTQPMPMERMLRIHFMQHWFNLSDPAMEDALYDSESMRRLADIELPEDAVPDESTILRFRHLLEQHREAARARGIRYRINRRRSWSAPLSKREKLINRARSRTRARCEHIFHGVKFTKVRYRGLAKSTARFFTAFALANLYLLGRRIAPLQARCL
jgi:hypothetical protein